MIGFCCWTSKRSLQTYLMAKCVDLLPICHTYVKKLITGLSCMYSKRNKCLICCWIHNFEHSVYNFLFCDGINPLPVLCGKIIFDSHPKNIQTWQWKHYVLGVFFCQYYKIPASHWGQKNGKVLDKNVLHSARTLKMHRGWAFPQNNDPKHTSKSKAQEDTR